MDRANHLNRRLFAPYRLARALIDALALQRHRQQLAHLNDDILDDIGITREQATAEAARPIWDAPAHWRC
jgi:uncharacterized protein YjiS (DUF1127 family)